ncbi:MAG: peptide chain release factor N(5)-glutamine methyltransferase [Gemmatimonadota bacterium]|nr:peptide chain release factor N(5)-glutamine methyltransferase [Gemmatimonadota bacterium]
MSDASALGVVLDRQAARLADAGLREPRRQAAALWAWLQDTSVGATWLARGSIPDRDATRELAAAVDRRVAGEPLPYVVGRAGFRTLELDVDRRVLIPRPETEGLVERVLRWARARGPGGRVADIGTGSGCIALSLAVEGVFVEIVATDASTRALEVAQTNRRHIQPTVPVEFRSGTLLEPLAREQFDVIVSNLPYLTEHEFAELEPSVRMFEPKGALVGGEDGMLYLRMLLERAATNLVDQGLLALEIDAQRATHTRDVARDLGWTTCWLERDVFGRLRYLLATKESTL